MARSSETITWTAHTCRLSEADVYIGIAPGVEAAAVMRTLGQGGLHEYPGRDIAITSAAAARIPLRLFAIRDSAAVKVEQNGSQSRIEGFQVVRLTFEGGEAHLAPGRGAIAAPGPRRPRGFDQPPVIAFLLTIGLPRERERDFFGRAVAEFLERSWASFPQLLRDVGCVEPGDGSR